MIGLKEKYQDYFKIGAAVSARSVETHADIIKTHFNSLTCENETKFSSVQPHENAYNFIRSDKIVKFARENNMAMRGHTFAWHNQTPKWVFEDADRETVLARLKAHIELLGRRYENDFYCWDVVNEVIEDKTEITYRESPWTKIVGVDFIENAFRYAREVLPKAQLFYNDYNEVVPAKRDKIYNMVKELLERDVPVDGIGMQAHWNIYRPSLDDIKIAIEKYADLGLKIHITEMDVSLFASDDSSHMDKPSDKILELQAERYGEFFALFRQYQGIIENVTVWGVADDVSWLNHFPVRNRKNWPLLFDDDHKPKEALLRIMDF